MRVVAQRVWALRLDLEPLVRITFANAESFGLTAAQLVSADYKPCQRLADAQRAEGVAGLIVPSAALPGTENVVLFGWRASSPYLVDPVDVIDVAASITADRATCPASALNAVRFKKDRTHAGAVASARGDEFVFREPLFG
jgi:hypothetical protein